MEMLLRRKIKSEWVCGVAVKDTKINLVNKGVFNEVNSLEQFLTRHRDTTDEVTKMNFGLPGDITALFRKALRGID